MRRLSAELGPSKSSIHRRLIELENVNRRCREVPHELTQELMRRRIDICEKLLRYPKDERYLRQIVTCDEKWLYYRYPDTSNQWIDKGRKLKQLSNMGDLKKRVFYVYGGTMKVLYTLSCFPTVKQFILNCIVYNCSKYMAFCVVFIQQWSIERVIIQHDNARPHKSKKTQ